MVDWAFTINLHTHTLHDDLAAYWHTNVTAERKVDRIVWTDGRVWNRKGRVDRRNECGPKRGRWIAECGPGRGEWSGETSVDRREEVDRRVWIRETFVDRGEECEPRRGKWTGE